MTGAALYFGMALLVLWLLAAARGPDAFAAIEAVPPTIPAADAAGILLKELALAAGADCDVGNVMKRTLNWSR